MDATGTIRNTSIGSKIPNGELDAPAKSTSVGQALRNARVRAGLSIEQVAAELKINTSFLQAIENMDREGLPHRTYALGFVRCYAGYLGFNPNTSVEQFEMNGCTKRTSHQDLRLHQRPAWMDFSLPRGFGLAIAVVGIVGLASWFGKLNATEPYVVPPVPEMLNSWAGSTTLEKIPTISQTPAQQVTVKP